MSVVCAGRWLRGMGCDSTSHTALVIGLAQLLHTREQHARSLP